MKSVVTSIAAGSLFAALAMAQPPRYTVTDLGTLPGGTFSEANFVSNSGLITGVAATADGTQHFVFWAGGHIMNMTPGLGKLNSTSLGANERGQAEVQAETSAKDPNNENFCGYGTGLRCLAFLEQYGILFPLPTLGGNNATSGQINSRGEIAGVAENSTRDAACPPGVNFEGTGPQVLDYEAVIWGPMLGQVRVLHPLPGDTVGMALWINDNGQAVGASGTCANSVLPPIAGGPHAVLWNQDGSITDLGNLGGEGDASTLNTNIGISINNQGQVTGGSALKGNATSHAFLWTKAGGKMRDLGTLPGDFSSVGIAINDSGEVVGPSFDADGNPRAYLWHNGVMSDLNTLVPANSPLYLLCAGGINSRGEIVGFGATSSGDIHAFMATPKNGASGNLSFGAESEDLASPMVLPEYVRNLIRQRLPAGRLGGRRPGPQ